MAELDAKRSVRIKVLSMGEGGVGKSCLIKRYCEGKFVSRYISTIGVDFGVRSVEVDSEESNGSSKTSIKNLVKVNFWDLSGHPEFYEVRNEFYKDTNGAMMVFDVSSKKSFESLHKWEKECQNFSGGEPIAIVVCGNKSDLGKKSRAVSEPEAMKWAQARGYTYFETSAKSGQNVNEMFIALFREVISRLVDQKEL